MLVQIFPRTVGGVEAENLWLGMRGHRVPPVRAGRNRLAHNVAGYFAFHFKTYVIAHPRFQGRSLVGAAGDFDNRRPG